MALTKTMQIMFSKALTQFNKLSGEDANSMKKFTYILTSLVLAVSLTACGGQGDTPVSSEPDTSAVSNEPTASADPVDAETPVTFADLTNDQLLIFESISEMNLDDAKQGIITIEELDTIHNDLIEVYIVEGQLPSNAHTIYDEWKGSIGYYEQFTGLTGTGSDTGNTGNTGTSSSADTNTQDTDTSVDTPSTDTQTNNTNTNTSTKPKPSVPQQQQQVENNGGGMTQEEKEALAAEQAGKVEVNQSGGVIEHGPGVDAFVEELPDDLPDWITQGMQ
jgi:hypothetical protein